MIAVVAHGPGDVRIEEMPAPSPDRGQLLVEVRACGFDLPLDQRYFSAHYSGEYPVLSQDSLFGHEGCGTVLQGAGGFETGDRIGYLGPGFVEQALVQPSTAARVPRSLSLEDAAMAEPLAVVANTLDHAAVGPGEDVVLVGAGFMGMLLLQGLRHRRAGRIVVVEPRPERRERAMHLGASACFDPLDERTVPSVLELTGGGVDKCIEASGNAAALNQASALLRTEGTLIIHAFYHHGAEPDLAAWHRSELTVINSHPSSEAKYGRLMARGLEMLADGVFDLKPLITHWIGPEEISRVPEMSAQADFLKAVVVLGSGP